MANSIKIKRSAVAAKVPLTTDLALGELAINTYDGKLYLKKDNGTASIVTVNAGGGGSGDVVGPGSSTDNAITRFDGVTGLLIQNSTATLDDSGVVSVSGANISGLTASSAVATDGSYNLVSVANTGTGDNVLATSPTLITPALGTPSALVGTNISGTASGLSIGGNAGTVTDGVYTTDTSTVTNTMLAGSIANNKLVNSAITINGTSTALGGSISVGTVTSVTGTSPISSTGGATPDISISAAGVSTSGYLSSTDWNTFNDKGDGAVASITGTANEIDVSSSTGDVTLSLPAIINADTTGSAATLTTPRDIAGVSFDGSANINIPLSNLSDVTFSTPVVNELLGYNGTAWVNVAPNSASAGTGVVFYNATPNITPVGANNAIPISTFATIPVTTAEQTISGTAVSNTVCFSAFISAALGRTIFDAGIWDFTIWAGVNSIASSTTTITRQIYTATPFVVGTVTTTGTGSSRTATASSGTPFATAVIDASATNTTASFLQTPQGLYQITARTSDTVVTITTPSGYTNESAVAGTVWKKLFGVTTPEITSISPDYSEISIYTTQPSTVVTAATKMGILGFVTSDHTRTISLTYNGTTRNTHVNTPLANLHNDLAGLNGGAAGEYYHSTAAEYAGTGTGVFVRGTSPTLVTPALGTPTALVGTNISGTATAFTASNVTTNANLTGPITSVGNATSIASQTGTGSTFVMNTSPVLVTPVINGFTGNTSVINIGSGQIYKDASGNVGIGTAAPSQKLEVYASANSLQIESVVRNDNAASGVAAIGFNTSFSGSEATSTKAGIGLVRGAAFGGGGLAFYNNNSLAAGDFTTADEKMRIDSSGNVGIGTSSPLGKLKVTVGDVAPAASGNMNTGVIYEATSSSRAINFGVNNTAGYSWINAAFSNNSGVPDNLVLMTGATERMRISSSGDVSLTGTLTVNGKWAGTGSSAGVLGGTIIGHECERNGTGSATNIMAFGNGSTSGKGLRMPFAGKLYAATLSGILVTGTVTVDFAINNVPNASYSLTGTGTASDISATGNYLASPLSFAAGNTIGWYQTTVPTVASGYFVAFYIMFD